MVLAQLKSLQSVFFGPAKVSLCGFIPETLEPSHPGKSPLALVVQDVKVDLGIAGGDVKNVAA